MFPAWLGYVVVTTAFSGAVVLVVKKIKKFKKGVEKSSKEIAEKKNKIKWL